METLKLIYDENKVAEIAEKILATTKEKIKKQIANEYYNELESYLYEHYDNNKHKIKEQLIKEISDEYINDPANYQFSEMRKKMFEENKEALIAPLTDNAIMKTMENILLEYTHENYTFNWQWKNGIVMLIRKNWDLFKDDKNIVFGLGKEIENLKYQNKLLQQQIDDIYANINKNELI